MRYRQPRAACDYRTDLEHPGMRRKVVIRNVTSNGACVELGPSDLRPGDTVKVWVMERPLQAEVRWNRNDAVGLKFARALSPREIAVIRHQMRVVPIAGRALRNVHGFAEL